MLAIFCFCGSNSTFEKCCKPYIDGIAFPPTAEALMRSRFSAYAVQAVNYLIETTHYSQRQLHSKEEISNWASQNEWLRLEIISATYNTVEFKAFYKNQHKEFQIHHEFSRFVFENDKWWYLNGE